MKRNAAISLFFITSLSLLCHLALAEAIDYDDEYNNAIRLKGSRSIDTDLLIKNTTEVLHKENMKTHAELEKLKKEVEEIKKAIKEVKDILEGGG